MNTTIIINERYCFKYLTNKYDMSQEEKRIGYIFDSFNKKTVLFLSIYRDLLKVHHRTMCLSEELTNTKTGDKAGLVLVSPETFQSDFIHTQFGYALLMHELGHYLNGDYKYNFVDCEKRRMEALKEGRVLECELLADEFAVSQCGLNKYIKAIEWMKFLREKVLNGCSNENRDLAMLEFEKRIEHCIEYAKDNRIKLK